MKELIPGVHKFIKHLDHIQKMKDGEVVAPLHVSIWPTIRCNFKCSYCCCKDTPRNDADLSLEVYKRAIDVLSRHGTKAIEFSGGGEPLLWKALGEAVEYTVAKGLKLSLITNGVLLNTIPKDVLRKFSWIRISFQSEEHAKTIDFTQLDGIKHNGSFIVTEEKGSFRKLKDIADFCSKRNINLRVSVEKPCEEHFENGIKGAVLALKSPYVFFSDKLHGTPNGCYMAWIRAAIDWNGNFLPCPAMHLSEEYRGSIPDKFKLCHVDNMEEWLRTNTARDLGFRCSTCNCGKENNDFFHEVISNVADEDFV